MTPTTRRLLAVLAILAILGVLGAGCGDDDTDDADGGISVADAWARATAPDAPTAAFYATIRNDTDDTDTTGTATATTTATATGTGTTAATGTGATATGTGTGTTGTGTGATMTRPVQISLAMSVDGAWDAEVDGNPLGMSADWNFANIFNSSVNLTEAGPHVVAVHAPDGLELIDDPIARRLLMIQSPRGFTLRAIPGRAARRWRAGRQVDSLPTTASEGRR